MDPINSALVQFEHAQSNSKKQPNKWKDQIAPNDFFFSKNNYQNFHVLLAPFILQNFKKILRAYPELWGCAIFGPFSSQTTIITFIYLLALFTVKNLLKFLQQVQSYNNAPFLGPKWSSSPKQIFFGKLLKSFSSIY